MRHIQQRCFLNFMNIMMAEKMMKKIHTTSIEFHEYHDGLQPRLIPNADAITIAYPSPSTFIYYYTREVWILHQSKLGFCPQLIQSVGLLLMTIIQHEED